MPTYTCACVSQCMWRSEDSLGGLVVSFPSVGPRAGTQVNKGLEPLTSLVGP